MGMQVNRFDPANVPLLSFASVDRSLIRFRTRWTRMCRELYPDWRVSQQKAVEDVCAAKDTNVWVAIDAGSTVQPKLDSESSMGEIYMIAVDPDFQCHGIGTALMEFALN